MEKTAPVVRKTPSREAARKPNEARHRHHRIRMGGSAARVALRSFSAERARSRRSPSAKIEHGVMSRLLQMPVTSACLICIRIKVSCKTFGV
jgi:hypothetical protein